MHRKIYRLSGVSLALTAGLVFGQGLGVTPALPDGASALTVTPEAGPWMILAASFGGAASRGQAEELATEIRSRYNLPTYVFNRTAEERRAEQERVARIKAEERRRLQQDGLPVDTPIHVKTVRIEDQYAVLIGGYKDDTTARKELEKIRKLKPSDKFAVYLYVPDPKSGKMREEAVNPFQSAFVCHNPSMPVEKPKQENDLGQRLKEYNASEAYSLLRCSKPFTLVVKSYRGASSIQSGTTTASVKLGMGRTAASLLNANEKEAHQLAEVLRKLGFEAFALHGEYNSVVTIGGFDSPSDPRLVQTAQHFIREMNRQGSGVNQLHLRVQFMAEPVQMPVPQVN